MASSLGQIEKQLAKLQAQANGLKAREVSAVVKKILSTIEHYSLMANDLFAAEPGKPAAAVKSRTSLKADAVKKQASAVKFRDDAGHGRTGHGKRPNWFKQAIEGGKTPEELLVRAQETLTGR